MLYFIKQMITTILIYKEKRIPLTKVVSDVFKNKITFHFVWLGKIKIDINAEDTLYSVVLCIPVQSI